MNTPSPLTPQGSLPARGKSTFKIAVFAIVTLHVVFIAAFLVISGSGCNRGKETPPMVENSPTNEPIPPAPPLTPEPAPTTAAAPAPSGIPTEPVLPTPPPALTPATAMTPPPPAPVTVPTTALPGVTGAGYAPAAAPSGAMREYVVAKNDSFSTIAVKMKVPVRAIEQANPGVDSTKLQIGQKLKIPEATAATALNSAVAAVAAAAGEYITYTVKSGDALEKISKAYGISINEIKKLNNLRTDRINAGQKLKLPAPKLPALETAPAMSAPAGAPVPSNP